MTPNKSKRARTTLPLLATLSAAALMLLSSSVLAGKKEREYMKKYVKPAIAAAKKAYKTSCGCDLKFELDPALKTQGELAVIRGTANSVADSMAKYCSDEDSKKAACGMKTLKIVKSEPTGFVFEGTTGTANSDGNIYIDWGQISEKIDP